MARKSGFVRREGRMRRETLWVPIPPVSTNITGSGTSLIYTASAAEQALRPYTIVRTHLFLEFESDQLAATEDWWAAIGFAVVSDQASAIGVTAVPTPITDLGSDAWYLHQFGKGAILFGDLTGFQASTGKQVQVDSKAMRKVEDGFDNIVTIESFTGFSGVAVATAGRQLLKLH